jgi:hypothetical protein
VQVRRTGTVSCTTLPRQPISPVPYAFSLYPGASIDGASTGGAFGSSVLNVANSGTSGNGLEVHTYRTHRHDHAGIFTANWGYGLLAKSANNMAIRGEAGNLSGLSQPAGPVGVAGIGDLGVFGSGDYQGVYGTSNSNTGCGGYFTNYGTDGIALYAYGSGGVLYLQNGSSSADGNGGDFITALNGAGNDVQFKVTTSGAGWGNSELDSRWSCEARTAVMERNRTRFEG